MLKPKVIVIYDQTFTKGVFFVSFVFDSNTINRIFN